jgi:hypothetical protein
MTWALITESSRLLVLESDDFSLLKNIQLTVSKTFLLSLVQPGTRTFNSANPELVETMLFVKSVLTAQTACYQQLHTEYADIAKQELLVIDIRKRFLGHILDQDAFVMASIESEIADINAYKTAIAGHDKFVCKTLYNLNYNQPVNDIKKQFIETISNPNNWADITDRHFVYGKLNGMFKNLI